MQDEMNPEKFAQARRAAWWKLTKAWGEASATTRIMAGPVVVPLIEMIEAMSAEIEALHSGCKEKPCPNGLPSTATPAPARGAQREGVDHGA